MRRPAFAALSALLFAASAYAGWDTQELDKQTPVYWPEGEEKVPLMIMLHGTGDVGRREYQWARWFTNQGVAVAMIHSARLRGRENFNGFDSFYDYTSDASEVAAWLSHHPRFDKSKLGLIGFSRGGTMAMLAGRRFVDAPIQPSVVFSFYPGAESMCPNTHPAPTDVHVFYGDADEWGIHEGLQKACKALAQREKNVTYHEFAGAHHGFDRPGMGSFSAYRRDFSTEFNADALKWAQQIIQDTLSGKWGAPPRGQ